MFAMYALAPSLSVQAGKLGARARGANDTMRVNPRQMGVVSEGCVRVKNEASSPPRLPLVV